MESALQTKTDSLPVESTAAVTTAVSPIPVTPTQEVEDISTANLPELPPEAEIVVAPTVATAVAAPAIAVTPNATDVAVRAVISDEKFLARLKDYSNFKQPAGTKLGEHPSFDAWINPQMEQKSEYEKKMSETDWSSFDAVLTKCIEMASLPQGSTETVIDDVTSVKTIRLPEKLDKVIEKIQAKVPFVKSSYTFKFRSHAGNELELANGDWTLNIKCGDAGWWDGMNFKLKDKVSGREMSFDSHMQLDPKRTKSMAELVNKLISYADTQADSSKDEEMRRWATQTKKWLEVTELSGRFVGQDSYLYSPESKPRGKFFERLSSAYTQAKELPQA